MVTKSLRILLAALATTGLIVFLWQLNSDRNDAIYIGQAAFLVFF